MADGDDNEMQVAETIVPFQSEQAVTVDKNQEEDNHVD